MAHAPAAHLRPSAPAPAAAPSFTAVVPVFNAMQFLPVTVPALLRAARAAAGVEIVFVDNGSSDGSWEYLQREAAADDVTVVRFEKASVGAVRNHGVRHSRGEVIAFLDCDCVVGEDYFVNAAAVLNETGAAATGCQVDVPARPHWIEAAWHHLHFVGRSRDVHYLNSGNFVVSRRVLAETGGFDEGLPTGEDAELGQRIVEAGHRIREAPEVRAVHLGNPASVRAFYRRQVWHGLGMFGTVGGARFDRPTAMMFAHLAATLLGVALLFAPGVPRGVGIATALALQVAVPAATVAFRWMQVRRVGRFAAGTALYWLYYWARLHALALIVAGRSHRYRK